MEFRCIIVTLARRYKSLVAGLVESGYAVDSYHQDNQIIFFKEDKIGSTILLRVSSEKRISCSDFTNKLEDILKENNIQYFSIFVLPINGSGTSPSYRLSNVPMTSAKKKTGSPYRDGK